MGAIVTVEEGGCEDSDSEGEGVLEVENAEMQKCRNAEIHRGRIGGGGGAQSILRGQLLRLDIGVIKDR
jgi:hypothetical protein